MRTRTARWDTHIGLSHTIAVQVDVLYGGVAVLEGLNVSSGEVILDRNAVIRGRCKIDLAEPTRIPNGPGDPLSPYGFELRVRRGITYADGVTELMPLGIFGIQRSLVADGDLVSQIDGLDRAQRVADNRLEDDYEISAGQNIAAAIVALLTFVAPWLTFSFASTTHTTPKLVLPPQTDPWATALSLARSAGCELFFDGDGVCVFRPEPSVTADPTWAVAEGAGGVLLSAAVSLDRSPAYNKVIATATNATGATEFTGEAVDDNPASPTYYYGPFGAKPRWFASSFLASNDQCAAAAAGILAGNVGVAKAISFGAVPNPAVEPGDTILITRTTLGIDELHMLDRVTIPLTADRTMTGDTRQVSA